jgi:hypothetical protein
VKHLKWRRKIEQEEEMHVVCLSLCKQVDVVDDHVNDDVEREIFFRNSKLSRLENKFLKMAAILSVSRNLSP